MFSSRSGIVQFILLAATILLFRVLYVDIYVVLQERNGFDLYDYISYFLRDLPSFTTALALDILFVWLLNRWLKHGKSPVARISVMLGYVIAVSILMTFLLTRFATMPWAGELEFSVFLISFLAVLLVNAVVVAVCDLVLYFRRSHRQLELEKGRKEKAIYQYDQLKRQLNPHFLFNSLNILDYLVQNDDPVRASDFIKKLAGVYRYLLNRGEEKLVTVADELEFVSMYGSLLSERFAEGLNIEVDIPRAALRKKIVPCGLQILVENATKHNIVNVAQPLNISIFVDGDTICVRNNLQLKSSGFESNGVGLANISGQYADIADMDIDIRQSEADFTVALPLL